MCTAGHHCQHGRRRRPPGRPQEASRGGVSRLVRMPAAPPARRVRACAGKWLFGAGRPTGNAGASPPPPPPARRTTLIDRAFGILCFNWLSCVGVPGWATFVWPDPPPAPRTNLPCDSFKSLACTRPASPALPILVATLSSRLRSSPAVHLCRCRPLLCSRTIPPSTSSWLKGRPASSSLVSSARLVWDPPPLRVAGLCFAERGWQLALDGGWGHPLCRSGLRWVGLVPSYRYSVWVPVSPLCRLAVLRLPVRQSVAFIVGAFLGTAHRRLSGVVFAGHTSLTPRLR